MRSFIYPSHDAEGARNWKGMMDWHVFSTVDMETWTDHGVIFSLQDIAWADDLVGGRLVSSPSSHTIVWTLPQCT